MYNICIHATYIYVHMDECTRITSRLDVCFLFLRTIKAEMLFLLHLGLFSYISFLFNSKLCSSSVDRSSLKVVK